ncbi:MAG: hypothetical protein R3213_12660, partial [Flavobacteriaceae bacterium]|nr:hypothetical protein [Flavobacteriaceae bacterium]
LSKRLIVSCFMTTCLLSFILVSCESEEIEAQSIDKKNIDINKKAGNGPDRIDICHYDEDTGGWMQQTVSEKSWEDHSLHGDQWLDRDGDGFTAANECGIGSMDDCDDTDANVNPDSGCDAKIFAIAYSNLNGEPGFQENSADVLISKLVDFNNDGVVSAGDKVITDRYPLDFNGTSFGSFTLKEHIIEPNRITANYVVVIIQGSSPREVLDWGIINGREFYRESYYQNGIVTTDIVDSVSNLGFLDGFGINTNSPSKPEGPSIIISDIIDNSGVDNSFLDVDIFIDGSN